MSSFLAVIQPKLKGRSRSTFPKLLHLQPTSKAGTKLSGSDTGFWKFLKLEFEVRRFDLLSPCRLLC